MGKVEKVGVGGWEKWDNERGKGWSWWWEKWDNDREEGLSWWVGKVG